MQLKKLKLNVALASDLNGFIQQIKPRFGSHHPQFDYKALSKCPDLGKVLESGVGSEFDTKGFAHAGLMKDIMIDLENLGVDASHLSNSAERFLQMWERAYDKNRSKVEYNVDIEAAKKTLIPYQEKK